MRPLARLGRSWRAFRSSLLFVPAILTFAALLVFALTSWLDTRHKDAFYDVLRASGSGTLGFLVFAGSAESARSILAAMVGTWATIVGVVYSVTLVTIQLSATKYSAQVIPVFERDRLNQVTLGAFTATFVYALLVLKTVRSAGDEGGSGDGFVPLLGVNLSVFLALASLFLLIAFIGNLTAYIRPKRFVQDFAKKGIAAIPERTPPEGIDGYRRLDRPPAQAEARREDALALEAEDDGFVAHVEWARLRERLSRLDPRPERVELLVAAGRHVSQGERLIRLVGQERWPKEQLDGVLACFVIEASAGTTDPGRTADTLADIAVTAMSGGATDVGVADAATRSLLNLTARVLERPEVGGAFEVDLGGKDVLVVVGKAGTQDICLRALRRIVDKAAREGYWAVGEALTRHLGETLSAAARQTHAGVWEEVLDWLRLVLARLLAFDDRHARRDMLDDLAAVVRRLREDGQPVRALDVEQAVLHAAREAGEARAAEDALVAAGVR